MEAPPPRNYSRLAGAIVVAGIVIAAAITASGYLRPPTTVTRTVTTSQATNPTTVTTILPINDSITTYYSAPIVTLPAGPCPSFEGNFVVGSSTEHPYDFNATVLPQPAGAVGVLNGVDITVHPLNGPSDQFHVVRFNWGAGTCASVAFLPSPSNATLFNGAVVMNWFLNSSKLYLRIAINAITTFKASSLPRNFQVGEYSFVTLCNGSCEITSGGTATSYEGGPVILLNITAQNRGSEMMSFGWTPGGPYNVLPIPSAASAYDGGVTVKWFTNSSGLYVSIITAAQTGPTATSTQTVSQTSSSAQMASYPANATFKYGQIPFGKSPSQFSIGGYSYDVVCDYEAPCTYAYNGSTTYNLGLMLVFNVTSYRGQSQTVVFQWSPYGPTPNVPLPDPKTTSVFDGLVRYNWFTNSSGVYIAISAKG